MEYALVEYIVNALWQVPLIAGATWLLARLVKPGPQVHHRLWLAALAVAVLLPIPGLINHSTAVLQNSVAVMNSKPLDDAEMDTIAAVPPRPLPVWSGPSSRMRTLHLATTTARWLERLYIVAVMLGMVRIVHAWLVTRRIVAHSRETSSYTEMLAEYCLRLKVDMPQIRESRDVSSPMIVGVLAPVLLLPEGFERHAKEEIAATLCHELAHVTRHDYAVNLICQVGALPLVWHPVVSELQQRIRLTRELVCDAMAAQEMKSGVSYARCLLALANSMLSGQSRTRQEPLVGLFTHNNLEERVSQLITTTRMTMGARLVRLAAGAAVTIASLAITCSFHVTPSMALSGVAIPQPSQVEPDLPMDKTAAPQPTTLKPPGVDKRQNAHRGSAHAKRTLSEDLARANNDHRVQLEDANERADDFQLKELMENAQRQARKAEAFTETPEWKAQMEALEKQVENAHRQALKAQAIFDTPEFKEQMEDVQRQAMKAKAFTETPEFKKQMQDMKKQMEDAHQQAMDSRAFTPEFQKQMENARQQAAKAHAFFDSPEFKKQMEEVQKQAEKAKEIFESPEFKERIENLAPPRPTGGVAP